MPYRVVFLGSPEFAVPSLQAVWNDPRLAVVEVVTQPDRRAGRGRRLTAPPVKVAAERLSLPIWQPATLRDPEAVEHLRALQADVFVVVAYGEILRRAVLELPKRGCLNVHPSLLPAYRGSSPIQAAIMNGDPETGVSIIRLVRRLDAGPILAQRRIPLRGDETAGELSRALAELAATMLPDVVAGWCRGDITSVEQDDSLATYTRELTAADARIDWSRPAVAVTRQVRAMNPWPRAWTIVAGRRLVVLRAEPAPEVAGLAPGELAGDQPLVGTGDGALRLLRVQPEGRQPMDAAAWLRGARLAPGTLLGT